MTKLASILEGIPYVNGWLVGKEKIDLIKLQRDADQSVVDGLDKEIERLKKELEYTRGEMVTDNQLYESSLKLVKAQLVNMPTPEEANVLLHNLNCTDFCGEKDLRSICLDCAILLNGAAKLKAQSEYKEEASK